MTTTIADRLRERLYMRALIAEVAEFYSITPRAVTERNRGDHIAYEARSVVAIKAREGGITLDVIGDALQREHSTVAYWLTYVESYRAQRFYRDLLAELPAFDPRRPVAMCGGCNGSGVYPLDRNVTPKHARGCGACHGLGGWEQ